MKRNAPLLFALALALAAGVCWIAMDAGPPEHANAAQLERAEGAALAAGPETGLDEVRERPVPVSDTEAPGAAEAAPPSALANAERDAPRRTSAGVETHTLRFRLEDDRGEPVPRATFTYTVPGGEQRLDAESAGGDYSLPDLAPGEVRVAVETWVLDPDQDPAWHAVPGGGERILLTFRRRASIAGRVVDDTGTALKAFSVELRHSLGGADMEEELGTDSGEDGTFAFEGVHAGRVRVATSNGFVEAGLELTLAPGEELEGVELRLEGGGTVQGRVLDADSNPVVGVDVIIVDATDFRTKTKTDEQGAFRLGPILPGTYEVTTILKKDPNANVFDQILSRTVTVARGDVIDVILQPKQETPVTLTGHVLHGGEKLGDCVVYAFRENEKLLEAVRMARSNDEGVYQLTLGGPGPYLFLFEPPANRSNQPTAPMRAEIPDATEVRMDLTLSASSISGRVVDADGAPVRGVNVVALPSDDYMDLELPDSPRGMKSGSEGEFSIPYLAEGEYVLHARTTQPASPLAWEPLAGVNVAAGTPTTGVELRATLGATISGTVRGPEGPATGAAVYVHDGAGRLVFLRGARTDAAGEFHIAGVPEGEVVLTARAPGLASGASDTKRARPGEETSFELRLTPASLLTATAVDASGSAVSCSIHVYDASGRDLTRVTSSDRAEGNFTDALSTTTKTVGPLPAGEYRVVATTRDGRSATRRVKVDGRRPTEVELRL